ncbi:MAG TPA: methyltransferase [Gemmatimonadaceae bacterium]|nr:methyltransferase [Gemmatimonadaceae bacterium]
MEKTAGQPRWVWLRMLGFTALLPGLVMVYAPYWWIITPQPVASRWPPDAMHAPALLAMIAGSSIYAVCAWRFAVDGLGTPAPWDPPRRLVTGGLYGWTRNPMYVGIVLALLGEAWLFSSSAQLTFAMCMAMAFHRRVLLFGERVLRKLFGADFGAEFEAYCARVRRWGVV